MDVWVPKPRQRWHNSPIIQKTVEPAEANKKSGRLKSIIRPYCSATENSRPEEEHNINTKAFSSF